MAPWLTLGRGIIIEWVGEPSYSIQLYNYQANNVSAAIIGSQSPISFKKRKKPDACEQKLFNRWRCRWFEKETLQRIIFGNIKNEIRLILPENFELKLVPENAKLLFFVCPEHFFFKTQIILLAVV